MTFENGGSIKVMFNRIKSNLVSRFLFENFIG